MICLVNLLHIIRLESKVVINLVYLFEMMWAISIKAIRSTIPAGQPFVHYGRGQETRLLGHTLKGR
jgi:hypothetical protein